MFLVCLFYALCLMPFLGLLLLVVHIILYFSKPVYPADHIAERPRENHAAPVARHERRERILDTPHRPAIDEHGRSRAPPVVRRKR